MGATTRRALMGAVAERRPSLVDGAEKALRDWLAPGRHRPGDRLPPEHDLAGMLGVSRGTLRTALGRLEDAGEIVRRQGSGTYVARVASPVAFDEGLERLESYTSLARRHGIRLGVRDLRVLQRPLGDAAAASLELPAEAVATTIARVLLADGLPAAVMVDVVRPGVVLPPAPVLRRELEAGAMVLDLLLASGVPIAFARTRVMPRLVTPDEPDGRALEIGHPTATLELEEVMRLPSGVAVQRSVDLFAPGGLDLHVIRHLDAEGPAQVPTARRPPTP